MSNRALPALCIVIAALASPARGSDPPLTPNTIGRQAFIEQRIGQRVPGDLAFVDERGEPVTLGDYFHNRPAILVLVYYSCPNLCPMLLRHLTEGLNGTALVAGRDFDVIIVSFDPRDVPSVAATHKLEALRAYKVRDAADGWHFLTGKQDSIDRLTQATGFHCVFDPQHNQFAHAAGVMLLDPHGMLCHYFFGIDMSPADLEASVHDAAAGRQTVVDQPDQQYCFDYDPSAARYGHVITRGLQSLGIGWVAILGSYIGYKLLQDVRGKGPAARKQAEVQS